MKANVLLEGDINTGKTTVLRTLLPTWLDEHNMEHHGAGLQTFVVSLDPGIHASLGYNLCQVKSPVERTTIHWHYLAPRPMDGAAAVQWATLMHNMTTKQLSSYTDPARREYTQFLDLYALTSNFRCMGCEGEYGSIYKMDEDCAIVLDGLTNLTTIARTNHVGGRPILDWPEIFTIQSAIHQFLELWWGSTTCTAILIAHLERETNPESGLSYLTMNTLGQKLAKRIEIIPDDIIVARRDGERFLWDTAEKQMVLKSRHLPLSNTLAADFAQIWQPSKGS